MVSPARRREAVEHLERRFRVSQRRACRVVGQHRSTQRYQPRPNDFEDRLVVRMNELAGQHPRYGYRMVHALLVDEGWQVNRKRIRRLWRREGNRVPPRRAKRAGNGAIGVDGNAAWNLPAVRPAHVWSYDFLAARTSGGGPLRVLNIVDEFTRECVGAYVARSMGAAAVKANLQDAFARAGTRPAIIRSDNGREFIAASLVTWLAEQEIVAAHVAKASPQQNCFVERFNLTMRNELLDGEVLHSVTEARVVIGTWVQQLQHRASTPGPGHDVTCSLRRSAASRCPPS